MIREFKGIMPVLGKEVYVAETAVIIGDTEIGDLSSIWFGAVIRGDVNCIRIGRMTNIQDGCVLHVSGGKYSLSIGDNVTVGHNAVVHGCRICNNVLIGMGATLLDNSTVEENSIVAAGALVKEGFVVPKGVLVAGVPCKIVRDLSIEEIKSIRESSVHYSELAGIYSGSHEVRLRQN